MTADETFMHRALQLARLGAGHVAPNPLVGCVLVRNGRLIGEGWHQRYGQAHAEVNAVAAVQDKKLLQGCTAYVSLEPCSHYGKTPPCADLLIDAAVGRVVISHADPNPLVGGQGVQQLRQAGIEVEMGCLQAAGRWLNRRFLTAMEKKRPYVILKWAQTADGFLTDHPGRPLPISGPVAQRLLHGWRAAEDAFLIGSHTALADNPRLNVRYGPGRPPVRVLLAGQSPLPEKLHLLDDSCNTLIFGSMQGTSSEKTTFMPQSPYDLPAVLAGLQQQKITSVVVEGGASVLKSFLHSGLWDEIRVLVAPMRVGGGVAAPAVQEQACGVWPVGQDTLHFFVNPVSGFVPELPGGFGL